MILLNADGVTIEVPDLPVTVEEYRQVVQQSYRVTLTGVDGVVWDLNRGPVTLMAGVKLFNAAPVTHWTRVAAAVDGARHTGSRTEMVEDDLPVKITGADWREWRDTSRAFFRSLAPEGEFVITVTAPDGEARSRAARFVSDGDVEMDDDPLLYAHSDHMVEFIATDPYWQGEVVAPSPFVLETPLDLYSETRSWIDGFFLYFSSSSGIESATVANPGDVPSWPRYTITGPLQSFTVGVGASLISSTTPLAAGSQIVVDSDPARRAVLNGDGVRVYETMGTVNFQPVPPSPEVALNFTVNGGVHGQTSIAVEFPSKYRRPL